MNQPKKEIHVLDSIRLPYSNKVGYGWLSEHFLEAVKRTNEALWAKGRRCAMEGQVVSLILKPGSLQASIAEPKKGIYHVTISVDVFSPEIWQNYTEQCSSSDTNSFNYLKQGLFPPGMLKLFTQASANLFPTEYTATCRGTKETEHSFNEEEECEHISAVFHVLSGFLDSNPFLLFSLRGKSKHEFLQSLDVARDTLKQEALQQALRKQTGDSPEEFWSYARPAGLMQTPKRPATDAALILRYGKFPFQVRAAMTNAFFTTAYQAASDAALALLNSMKPDEN